MAEYKEREEELRKATQGYNIARIMGDTEGALAFDLEIGRHKLWLAMNKHKKGEIA